ncbi:MAG: outer membrane beta-barrel protein [Bacteroidales bacterium]|nr:outer membrane beta-barrel protein [Bacteroidales bacterium]
MKKILFLGFVFLSLSSHSHNLNYSISIKYNQSFINSVETKPDMPDYSTSSAGGIFYSNIGGIKESYTSKSGGSINGKFSFSVYSGFFIESGLQLSLIQFKKESEIVSTDISELEIQIFNSGSSINNVFGSFFPPITSAYIIENENTEKLGNTSTVYSEIPILLGYSFFNNRLKCKLGIITSFLAHAEVYTYDYDNPQGYFTNDIIKDKSADGFKNLIWNGSLEIEYLFYKNISVNLNYSRSLNSIYDDYASVGEPKYNVFSLGISYNFFK